MRYKNNVLDKITRFETLISKFQIQLNQNVSREDLYESIDALKEQMDELKSMISNEPDDFEQQFAPTNYRD